MNTFSNLGRGEASGEKKRNRIFNFQHSNWEEASFWRNEHSNVIGKRQKLWRKEE
jgi:hypothetical protein